MLSFFFLLKSVHHDVVLPSLLTYGSKVATRKQQIIVRSVKTKEMELKGGSYPSIASFHSKYCLLLVVTSGTPLVRTGRKQYRAGTYQVLGL